ncbi:MAG: GNAT family N-acetyltransferase [Candidatus Elarobacter sp.]
MPSPLLVPLATPRLRLEPIRAGHADLLFEGFRDPSLYAYETDDPPGDLESLRERYRRVERGRSPGDDEHWLNWVPVVRDTGAAAGFVQATVEDDRQYASIGYALIASQQHRGFATEAVGAVIDHLLGNGVALLHAVIDVRNAPSISLVERLRFVRVGTRRSDDVIGGVRGFDHDYVRRAPGAGAGSAPNSSA